MGGKKHSLRLRILTFVGALVLLSLLGSTISLFRITEMSRILDAMNRVSVPLGKNFVQMQSDVDVFRREMERGLGYAHWKDPNWRPRPVPRWIMDVLESEVERASVLIRTEVPWADAEVRARWSNWATEVVAGYTSLKENATRLYVALEQKDEATATELYPRVLAGLEEWRRQVQNGGTEYDRDLRHSFALAESRVADLRSGLETVLVVVVLASLLMLWMGERALRPLGELTRLAREIAQRGLRKDDKSPLPRLFLARSDEVSQLAREFHRMATALLEREKILEEQNRLLREAENLAAVGRMSAQVAHEVRNPLHAIGLEAELAYELAARAGDSALKQSLQSILSGVDRLEKITENYLRLSRLSAGEKKLVDLGEVLEVVLATYSPACQAQGVFVDWERAPGVDLRVWGDRDLLEQVLGNLMRNALQAVESTASPRIEWKLGRDSTGNVSVRVQDNGPGIAKEVREKLFTPFVTTRAQGTGLGLSFVKKVVEDHGGSIRSIDDERAQQTGACFELSLSAFVSSREGGVHAEFSPL